MLKNRKKDDPPPTFADILYKAVSNGESGVVNFLLDQYKEDFVKVIKREAQDYVEYYPFLGEECSINLSEFGIDVELLGKFHGVEGRASRRKDDGIYSNASELFDLIISRYLDSVTGASLRLLSPFSSLKDSLQEVFNFTPFAHSSGQIKVTTNKGNFFDKYAKDEDWSEYATFCKYLDTCADRVAVAKAILACSKWFPEEAVIIDDVELVKTKELLDAFVMQMREDLNLAALGLTAAQMRAATMMFGLSICEHHRVPGALKHFRTCLRMVCDGGKNFSQAFGEKLDDTMCVLSATGGTGALREIYTTGIIPAGLDDSFDFSDSSDDEKAPGKYPSKPEAIAAKKPVAKARGSDSDSD